MVGQSKQYKVIVASRATQMLVTHTRFLAQASEAAAERLVIAFNSAAETLRVMPHRCPWLFGKFIPRNVYRKLIFEDRYLLIYQVIDDVVYVEYVVDCRQDYGWLIR